MDLVQIAGKVLQLQDSVTTECRLQMHLATTAKEKESLEKSQENLNRFIIFPETGGYTEQDLLMVLFLLEGTLHRYFRENEMFTINIRQITRLRGKIMKLIDLKG